MSYSKAVKIRRYSGVYLGVTMGSADVGQAVLDDGRMVFITWGRNLTREQADHFRGKINREIVCTQHLNRGDEYELYEFVLLREEVDGLRLIDGEKVGGWVTRSHK